MKSKQEDCDCGMNGCRSTSPMQTILPLVTVVLIGVMAFGLVGLGLKGSDGAVTIKEIETGEHSLYVAGEAWEDVVPDQFEVAAAITTTAPTAQGAVLQNAQKIADVKNALASWGASEREIRTTNYNVYEDIRTEWTCDDNLGQPIDEGCNWASKSYGFVATESLAVKTTRVSEAGGLIDAMAQGGASTITYTQFSVSKARMKEIQDRLALEAVKDAHKKAAELADALGVTLGKPISASEAYDDTAVANAFRGFADEDALLGSELSAGEQRVSVSISVSYEIQ